MAVKYAIKVEIISGATNYVLRKKKQSFIVLEKIDAEYSFLQS